MFIFYHFNIWISKNKDITLPSKIDMLTNRNLQKLGRYSKSPSCIVGNPKVRWRFLYQIQTETIKFSAVFYDKLQSQSIRPAQPRPKQPKAPVVLEYCASGLILL